MFGLQQQAVRQLVYLALSFTSSATAKLAAVDAAFECSSRRADCGNDWTSHPLLTQRSKTRVKCRRSASHIFSNKRAHDHLLATVGFHLVSLMRSEDWIRWFYSSMSWHVPVVVSRDSMREFVRGHVNLADTNFDLDNSVVWSIAHGGIYRSAGFKPTTKHHMNGR